MTRDTTPPPAPNAAGRIEPAAPPPPPSVLVTPPPSAAPVRKVFAGDRPEGRDALGIDATLAQLAELAAHKGAQAPLCIGLVGGAGSGKSFALNRLTSRIRDIAGAVANAGASPFAQRIEIVTVDASALDGDPALGVAAQIHTALTRPYPELARDLGAVARDPHTVLRETEEKLDETRRRLDAERRALDEACSRRARLTESVLYEAAGSGVDAYARANRSGIESRLVGFGLGGDPIRTYKDLVQVVSGAGGALGLTLKSLWAFKGQTKLIITAIILVAIGIGLGIAIDDQSRWLGDLRDGPKTGATVADWFQAHMTLLSAVRTAAFGLAALAIIANVLRAFAFMQPILKGAKLLTGDLEARRRDLDGLCAHQTKRVDALEADVDRLSRGVAEAEQRIGAVGGQRQEASPFAAPGVAGQARTFFSTLDGLLTEGKVKAPQRVVLALDHLDALDPGRAAGLLETLSRSAGAGIVTLAAFDPARIDADGRRRDDLERWIQVPLRLDRGAAPTDCEALVRETLGCGTPAANGLQAVDPRRSDLDASVDDEEVALLARLADLAGRTPRAVKRLSNLYLVARLGEDRALAALAFMLALEIGGSDAERRAVAEAFSGDPGAAFDLSQAAPRLRTAWEATIAAGGRIARADADAAARRAAQFSLRPAA